MMFSRGELDVAASRIDGATLAQHQRNRALIGARGCARRGMSWRGARNRKRQRVLAQWCLTTNAPGIK